MDVQFERVFGANVQQQQGVLQLIYTFQHQSTPLRKFTWRVIVVESACFTTFPRYDDVH